jgi:hypothetical protein
MGVTLQGQAHRRGHGEPAVDGPQGGGLPQALVLYCGRHDYGTYVYSTTCNLKAVMDSMGHADVKTTMEYQAPGVADRASGLERTAHLAACRPCIVIHSECATFGSTSPTGGGQS